MVRLKKCGQRTGGDEIAPSGSNFKTRKNTVSRGTKSRALSLSVRIVKKAKIPRPPGYAASETAVYDLMPAKAKLTFAIPAAAAAGSAYGKAKWACERVTKNHGAGWNRREIPEGHVRRFILRESYWRNVRKFEIITLCSRMCVCTCERPKELLFFEGR